MIFFIIVCMLKHEVIYVTIVNSTFWPTFYLTGVHSWSELQHVGHVVEQKIKYQPIRTKEIVGVRF